MKHTCHALDCEVIVPPAMLMCRRHWQMVPEKIQKQVWSAYRRGQEYDKNPSAEYAVAYKVAINNVAQKEGKKLPFPVIRTA